MTAPIERVKALLAALPKEDQAELRRYLGDILLTEDEAESIHIASLEAKTPAGRTITYTFRQERVRCGKPSCWCADGGTGGVPQNVAGKARPAGRAGLGHGPYTYKYWKEPGSGKLRKQYVGKGLPPSQERILSVSRRRDRAAGGRARGGSAASSGGRAPRA